MATRAGMAAATSATATTATTGAATLIVADRIAISFGRLAHIARFVRIARAFRPAGDLIGRTMKATDHLAKRLDLALVGGFLALGFLDEFEQLVHRLRGLAQGAERRFNLLKRLANAGRFGWLSRRWRPRFRRHIAVRAMLRWRMALARRAGGRLVSRLFEGFRRRLGRCHFLGSWREERLVIGAALLAGIGVRHFRTRLGRRFDCWIGRQFAGVFGSRLRGGFGRGRVRLVARAGSARASTPAAAAATAARAGGGRSGSRIGWRCWIRHVVQRATACPVAGVKCKQNSANCRLAF
jgi:hypothetical protein